MSKRSHSPEQIIVKLREAEILSSQGKKQAEICRQIQVSQQTYVRWRKEYGGLSLDQAKRLKELEKENARLKHVVAELSLDNSILKEVAQGKY